MHASEVLSNAFLFLPASTTLAPIFANSMLVAAPMPELAPERMNATVKESHQMLQNDCPSFTRMHPKNHHSSLEHANNGASCLLLAFLNPTTCHLSNLRSINLIGSLLLPFCFLLCSFFGALYRPPWPFLNLTH